MSSINSFSKLPNTLFQAIAQFLQPQEAHSIAPTCKVFQKVLTDNRLWLMQAKKWSVPLEDPANAAVDFVKKIDRINSALATALADALKASGDEQRINKIQIPFLKYQALKEYIQNNKANLKEAFEAILLTNDSKIFADMYDVAAAQIFIDQGVLQTDKENLETFLAIAGEGNPIIFKQIFQSLSKISSPQVLSLTLKSIFLKFFPTAQFHELVFELGYIPNQEDLMSLIANGSWQFTTNSNHNFFYFFSLYISLSKISNLNKGQLLALDSTKNPYIDIIKEVVRDYPHGNFLDKRAISDAQHNRTLKHWQAIGVHDIMNAALVHNNFAELNLFLKYCKPQDKQILIQWLEFNQNIEIFDESSNSHINDEKPTRWMSIDQKQWPKRIAIVRKVIEDSLAADKEQDSKTTVAVPTTAKTSTATAAPASSKK